MTSPRKTISIICPVFNEETAIPLFHDRIRRVIAPLEDSHAFEIIFTNNGSSDGSLAAIRAIGKNDPRVGVLSLSRNFGYQCSLLSGLRHARGDAVMFIDVDCEDPPEMLPVFLEHLEHGYDIVYGKRDKRPEFFLVQWARKLFYRVTRAVADFDFILDMAEFAMFTREAANAILANESTYPFIRSEIAYVGFRRMAIPYARQRRISGKTHYNVLGMIEFAIAGMLTSSTFPLRAAAYVGFPLAAFNLAAFFLEMTVPAWAERLRLASVAHLNHAFFVTVLAFLSMYLARVYKNTIRRPLYVIDWKNSTVDPGPGGSR